MKNFYELLQTQAAKYPGRLFLLTEQKEYTYEEFLYYVDNLSVEIEKELRIAGFSHHTSVLVLTEGFLLQGGVFFALQKLGAIPVLMHQGFEAEDMNNIIKSNGLNGLMILQCSDGKPKIRVIVRKNTADNEKESIISRQPTKNDVMGALSSGSTGIPKVMYRTYDSWAGFFQQQNDAFRIDSNSRLFINGSLSFTGNLNMLMAQLAAGAATIATEGASVKLWYQMLTKFQATHVYMVPVKLQLLARSLKNKNMQIEILKAVITGSQLMTKEIRNNLQKAFPFSTLILYYGASELSYITYRTGYEAPSDMRNLGRPFPGIRVFIKNHEIYVYTPFHVSGVEMPFSVGDTGMLNDSGELIFFGRKKDWINKGGYKISCINLETQLKALPQILDAVVLPIEDKVRGQDSAAFIVRNSDCSEQTCRLVIRQKLDARVVPKKIVFLKQIPLNDRGKADRFALRRML